MHHNRYLAKSNPEETIQQHTDNLLKQLEILKSIYPNINVNFDLLYYACLYHDLGKISLSFQKKVDKNLSDSITNNEEFPHGVLSTLFIDTKKLRKLGFSSEEVSLLYQSVYYHHHRKSLDNVNKSKVTDQIDSLKLELENFHYDKLDDIKLVEFKERLLDNSTIEDQTRFLKKYIILKGLLNRLDYAASAHIKVENKNDFLEEYLELFMKKLKKKEIEKGNPEPKWNDLQFFMKENSNENLVIIAQTGMGKTEGSLLWIGNNKGFFTLPIRTANNAIYNRLKFDILNGEKITERIALLHGDTKSFYYNNSPENETTADIEGYFTKTRQLSLPITVSTLDQLFTIVFKYRNYESVLATLSYSKVVIDEIQMYGPELIGYLIAGLIMIQNIGGKFAIVTATFPGFLKQLMDEYGLEYKMSPAPFVDKGKIRHSVQWIEEKINSDFIEQKYYDNRILVICNTVKECQSLYSELKDREIPVNMFHSKFIKKDREQKEADILEFGKLFKNEKRNNDVGIWITTSVAEASLDIDFDILITELSDVNSLFQRFGRCYRKREWSDEGYNCYVFDGGKKKCSGVSSVIDEEIFNISKKNLRRFFTSHSSKITEEEKMNLVESIYSYENIKNTKYYKTITHFIDKPELYLPAETDKKEAQQNFREIASVTVMPKTIYDENKEEILNCLEKLNDFKNDISKRVIARQNIYKYTLTLGYEEFANVYKHSITNIIELSSYEKIQVIDCNYSYDFGISAAQPNSGGIFI